MLRVLIADDHALLREGLTRVLTKEFNGVHVGEVGTGQDVLQMAGSQTWDALILDINLPDKNGIEVLKEPAYALEGYQDGLNQDEIFQLAIEAYQEIPEHMKCGAP